MHFQFTLLCGKSPFLTSHRSRPTSGGNGNKNTTSKGTSGSDNAASAIIRRIKNGDFKTETEAWKYVSPAAKNITKGLLTVDTKKRLTMADLFRNPWVNGLTQEANSNNNNPPSLLLSPAMLSEDFSVKKGQGIERHLKQAYNAYHTVTRETFLAGLNDKSRLENGLGSQANKQKSSSVSSSSSSLSSLSSSGAVAGNHNHSSTTTKNKNAWPSKVQDYLQQSQPFLGSATATSTSAAAVSIIPKYSSQRPMATQHPVTTAATSAGSVSIAPMFSEALTGTLAYPSFMTSMIQRPLTLPSTVTGDSCTYLSTTGGVSITKMGPMTRSRKRKMDDSCGVTSGDQSSSVTITKREKVRTTGEPAATSGHHFGSGLTGPSAPGTWCATAIMSTATASSVTCTALETTQRPPVTITID